MKQLYIKLGHWKVGILLHIGISASRLKEEGHHDASATRRRQSFILKIWP